MPIIARTKRLCLRTWKRGDGKRFAELCNTPVVMKYLGGVQSQRSLREDVAWFGECFDSYGHTLWVVERLEDGAFLGFAGLDKLLSSSGMVPDHLDGQVEIGWRLREDAWGQGYATEAAAVSLDIAFRILRITHVISRAAAGNLGSIRIMEKLGMFPSRQLEVSADEVLYEIDR
jgi:RimJ/RimL family protein N-acetyltransferase